MSCWLVRRSCAGDEHAAYPCSCSPHHAFPSPSPSPSSSQMKLGYVSRVYPKDKNKHVVLAVQVRLGQAFQGALPWLLVWLMMFRVYNGGLKRFMCVP